MTKPIDFTKPVQTKGGRSVRILCTDGGGCYPIVGLVAKLDDEEASPVRRWTTEGFYVGAEHPGSNDLRNTTVKRTMWLWVVEGDGGWLRPNSVMFYSAEAAEKHPCVNPKAYLAKIEWEE